MQKFATWFVKLTPAYMVVAVFVYMAIAYRLCMQIIPNVQTAEQQLGAIFAVVIGLSPILIGMMILIGIPVYFLWPYVDPEFRNRRTLCGGPR